MIKELIIRGDFEVEGMPDKCNSKLKYLRIKSGTIPQAFIEIVEFSSDESQKAKCGNECKNVTNFICMTCGNDVRE